MTKSFTTRWPEDTVMCLIALAWHVVPGYSLIVAANRDEFHARRSAPAGFWPQAPELFGGRDLQSGGSWMAVTRDGRFAALTNHRDPVPPNSKAPSRGHLVTDYLRSRQRPQDYLAALAPVRAQYNGFNLLVADADSLGYSGNSGAAAQPVAPGFHALSNARLNTPWPKTTGLLGDLSAIVGARPDEDRLFEQLFTALAETGVPHDAQLPATGVDLERERTLAPRKIVAPVYGTRCSSVLAIRADASIRFDEISFDHEGRQSGRVSQSFTPSGVRST